MGIYLSTPNKEKVSEDLQLGKLRAGCASMQGWRVNMEDSHIAKFNVAKDLEDVHVFAVFDGHGGKEVARFVEKHFIEELLVNEAFKRQDFENALRETFLKMDVLLLLPENRKEINQLKGNDDDKNDSYAGCTACVALLVKNTLYVANAGDSRCVLSSNKNAIEMSLDHKPDLEVEKNRINKAGGYISDGRVNGNLNLSRAIGDLDYKKDGTLSQKEQLIIAFPDIKKRELTPDDEFLILGCDGIWESLTNQEIVEFVGKALSRSQTPSKIAEELLEKMIAPDTSTGVGCDNMTCIIVTLK